MDNVLLLARLPVAVALIPTSPAWWGAIAALALLLLFVAGIGFNLARGRRPDCRCFGQLHSEPVGGSTLVRNGLLALVAAVLVLRGPAGQPGLVAWLAGLTGAETILLAGL